MTLLRREVPSSRGASRSDPMTGRRIASARTLQSCPHRARADAVGEACGHQSPSVFRLYAAARLSRPVMAAQMNPTNSRATAATATGERLPWPTRCR